jgi:gas vesicle protein
MGETPDHIREDIEETRVRMGETVEAIGYKTDVKSRVKDSIVQKKDAVVGGADSLVSRVSGVVPDGRQVKAGAQKVGVSRQNPLGMAIAGAAVGFVAGTLLPSTTVEDERLGEMSDQVGEKAREAGQEALDRTKDVARDAVDEARQTVEDRSGDEAQKMASSLRDKAQEVGSSSPS